jgi:hypothetical protein
LFQRLCLLHLLKTAGGTYLAFHFTVGELAMDIFLAGDQGDAPALRLSRYTFCDNLVALQKTIVHVVLRPEVVDSLSSPERSHVSGLIVMLHNLNLAQALEMVDLRFRDRYCHPVRL